jgi:D-alanyl-D-alanine carboxypeptidase
MQLVTNPTKLWTVEELISYAYAQPYYFNPGTGYHYCNTNTVMIGRIIEMITGISLESNIRTRIINELNLINTTYLIAGTDIPGYHSSAYYGGDYEPDLPECSEYIDVSWAGASGSMISNIFELRTYVEALTSGRFLSSELQQQRMNCNDMGNALGLKYGLGIFEYKGFYGHNGGIFGYTSLMVNSPERNCTIVIWYYSKLDKATPTSLLAVIPKLMYPDL